MATITVFNLKQNDRLPPIDATLKFADAGNSAHAVSFVLEDAKGTPYGTSNYDLVLYVPAPSHREDGKPSWLELGGARKSTRVELPECKGVTPCIVQARRVGEQADAIPADGCVVAAEATGCTLFLPPGNYDVIAVDESEAVRSRTPLVVGAR